MENEPNEQAVVDHMLAHDQFSQWLGIRLLDLRPGYCKIEMTVRPEMINGFGVVHGGIAFSFGDSAFAFACNSRNNLSVALDTSITFTRPVMPGDVLTGEASELHNGGRTGLYLVTITNQRGEQVGLFKGTCFRTGKPLLKQGVE